MPARRALSAFSPGVERRVYLLLLDDENRLMLCGGCCSAWTVPQIPVDVDTDFRTAATRFLSERFQIRNPRYGSLYGIHRTSERDCWERDRPTVSRVFVVRIDVADSDSFLEMSSMHTRWNSADLISHRREISPEGVILFAAGYYDGWLPDGPVSLY
ncbi:hypothetical protein ACFWGI_31305 [Streptomyces niveus]|uniref:hypothetical protein n=1 Tax=Streptomyces niveus TaxID=193462 RepID=UPI0036515592